MVVRGRNDGVWLLKKTLRMVVVIRVRNNDAYLLKKTRRMIATCEVEIAYLHWLVYCMESFSTTNLISVVSV